MLHKDPFIISPITFRLIQQLQSYPALKEFYLVGGTALALQLGHRNSIDIDLFSRNIFTVENIAEALVNKHTFTTTLAKKNAVLATVDNIKTDFVRHDYPLIQAPITEEGITFLSLQDITAMKFHAIIQSGKRLKDFIDIYFLLEHLSMSEMVECFEKKYTYTNAMIALKAINYFGDIDEGIDPPKLWVPLQLDTIIERIRAATLNPYITFQSV